MKREGPVEGSPLGKAFGDSVGRSKGKKSLMLIAVAAALGLGGTVLASNITINTSNEVEFGQGVATTTPCDSTINVAPSSVYDDSSQTFYLNDVIVSDIEPACNNTVFVVSVYASGAALPTTSAVATITATESSSPYASQTFAFRSDNVDTQYANRVTVETRD